MIKTGPQYSLSQTPNAQTLPEIASAKSRKGTVESVTSEQLLGTRGELKIQHNGETYSLRRTRQGKLILTK